MRPPWTIRRRVIFGTLAFCAAGVGWLTVAGADTALNETIANGLILLAGGVVGSYVFGAAWDDMNVMKNFGKEAYQVEADFPPPYQPVYEPPPQGVAG